MRPVLRKSYESYEKSKESKRKTIEGQKDVLRKYEEMYGEKWGKLWGKVRKVKGTKIKRHRNTFWGKVRKDMKISEESYEEKWGK